jgi:hypothetical protein
MFVLVSCCSTESPTPWTPIPASDLGAIVANVGEAPIYAKQVSAVAKVKGISNREALQEVIETNLLATAVIKTVSATPVDKDLLVQRLLDRDFEPTHSLASIPEKEIKELYQRALSAYVRPRLVDIGLLAIYTGGQMKPEPREKCTQTARELRDYLKKHSPKTLPEFSAIATDPNWKGKQVVFHRFLQGPEKPLSPVVGSQVLKLKSEGEMTPMIEDKDGFFVARYIGEQPPRNIPFSEVQEELRKTYFERWRPQQFLNFTGAMMRLHSIETFAQNLPGDQKGS